MLLPPKYDPRVWLGVLYDVLCGRLIICRGLGHLHAIGGEMHGKTVLVTGPTSGIGRETAKELARRGALVLLGCRNLAAGEKLIEEMKKDAKLEGRAEPSAEVVKLDLSSLDSVRECAARVKARDAPLDVLVGNAGIFAMSAPREVTKDGHEAHFGCNYLAHFLLTLMLLPSLLQPNREARVVMVSSKLHEFGSFDWKDLHITKGYSALRAYGQSKLAQIMFCYELERQVAGASSCRLRCLSVHPGNVLTDVVRSLPGPIRWLYRRIMARILLSPDQGARASVFAATEPSLSQSPAGGYLGQNCAAESSSRISHDTIASKRLWEESLKLVGLPTGFMPPP
uniref:Uncharacterized protein n=1 Tax=Pyramimonas obovata TaxID=1411642 RepID=A0A7S0N3G5_9CHLO|mmetsp:Transcript_19075/g.41758  ORF Transcript_19075/g.41758 Transcript_19075/m.41758 type:complete len:340 (+) Transcript_19075:152-1171(+)|eukprot:CAMPEP_0118921060 /NCGR_PEP_ID=MMETSP1169-20130426/454_1 /TAXON_ID=36882 /ORGANISM="Pyramimonas obovata, Strain CCMP722" /LENGTH=339 /DNA_ID=CAMNT_0006861711 /DNA_START=133 /DNA_END=1152 /DNA_ORIENTATION=+